MPHPAERDVPTPLYDAVAPSDLVGARAVEQMLADLPFPATAEALRARAGTWRVPVRSPDETVSIGELLAEVSPKREFATPRDVADAVREHHAGF